MKPELETQLESLLFSSGKRMTEEELAKLCKASPEEVRHALLELKRHYDEKNGSLMVMQDGHAWKLTVREQFLSLVKNIVTETELPKAVIETLAVIAFKHPILQSEIIKIRGNKGYEHLAELEESGYVGRERYGRTKKIKLMPKFFEYFDLPPEKLKDAFAGFEAVESAIIEKERGLAQRMKVYKQETTPAVEGAQAAAKSVPFVPEAVEEDTEAAEEQATEDLVATGQSAAEEVAAEEVTPDDAAEEKLPVEQRSKGIEIFMHEKDAPAEEREEPREVEEELVEGEDVEDIITKKAKALESGKAIKEPKKKDALDFVYDEISEDQRKSE